MIVIESQEQNKTYGSELLQLIERWLDLTGVTIIHVASTKSAANFYFKNGYSRMPFGDPDGHPESDEDINLAKSLLN